MRMSSGPCAATVSASATTCAGLRRSMPMIAQAIEPVGAVGHRGEAACGVAREARRDRRVRAVAQQPQRDVHADLRAAAGEQRAPARQVGARVAARVMVRRAVRAELVVEGVDLVEALLADVTRARAQQRPGRRAGRRRLQRQALRLVVDAAGRCRRGRRRDGRVGFEHRAPALGAATLLDGLEEAARWHAARRPRRGARPAARRAPRSRAGRCRGPPDRSPCPSCPDCTKSLEIASAP